MEICNISIKIVRQISWKIDNLNNLNIIISMVDIIEKLIYNIIISYCKSLINNFIKERTTMKKKVLMTDERAYKIVQDFLDVLSTRAIIMIHATRYSNMTGTPKKAAYCSSSLWGVPI